MPQDGRDGMVPSEHQHAWVERVLGVTLNRPSAPEQADPTAWRAAYTRFQSAADTVSAQIENLRKAIADYGNEFDDPELADLAARADFGINGFTNNTFVRLRAALMSSIGNDPESLKKALPKAVETAQAVRDAMAASEQVDACDDNPFGVTVSILDTLVPAVSDLAAVGSRLLMTR